MTNEIKLQLLDKLVTIIQFGKEAIKTDLSESAVIDKLVLLQNISDIPIQNEDLLDIYTNDIKEVAALVFRII